VDVAINGAAEHKEGGLHSPYACWVLNLANVAS
jgi:hypothetical protein